MLSSLSHVAIPNIPYVKHSLRPEYMLLIRTIINIKLNYTCHWLWKYKRDAEGGGCNLTAGKQI